MESKFVWPDKSDFSDKFVDPADRSLKQVREFKTELPGTISRVVEFHHNFQCSLYVESRGEKKNRYTSAQLGINLDTLGKLIARRR
jgi:hypothetical protein